VAQMVTLVAYLKAKAGKEAELRKTLMGLVGPTRKEAGCINYHLHISQDDPRVFMFYENWRSKPDLDAHLKMPYLADFFGKRETLLEGEIDLKLYTMISEMPR
jgi:quinol monooxygenase YgiN